MSTGRVVGRSAFAAGLLLAAAVVLVVLSLPVEAQQAAAKEPAYRSFPLIGSRLAVWAVAQLHLNFAAFILGVPIFAVIIEIIGWRTGEARYDWLSHE
jgi:cytochrome bd ubiquinol oxidase subunit I